MSVMSEKDVPRKSSNPNETFDRGSTDAVVWAEAFEEHKQRNNWTLDDIDECLMIGWFANAMCAQLDHDLIQIERLNKQSARKTSDLIDADRRFKSTSNDLFTVQKERNELQFLNERLRQIAAHVPAKIYIAAKEKAGYGTTINPAPGSGLTLRD